MKLLKLMILLTISSPVFAGTYKVIKRHSDHNVVRIEVGEHEHFNQRDFDRYMKRHGYDYRSHHYAIETSPP